MAEWLKHQTVNLGYVGSSPTVPANIKLMQQINTYAELRKLKLNKLFKHPTYNIYQVIKNRNVGFCRGGSSNITSVVLCIVLVLISHFVIEHVYKENNISGI